MRAHTKTTVLALFPRAAMMGLALICLGAVLAGCGAVFHLV